jgi:hypothetical protein
VERRLSFEDSGWAEGMSVTSRRFNEAVLRAIFSLSWSPALYHHGQSGYQPFSLVPNPYGVVVCTVQRFQKSVDRRWWSSPTPPAV